MPGRSFLRERLGVPGEVVQDLRQVGGFGWCAFEAEEEVCRVNRSSTSENLCFVTLARPEDVGGGRYTRSGLP